MGKVFVFLAMSIMFMSSCKSYKEYKLTNYALAGLNNERDYTMWLDKDFTGKFYHSTGNNQMIDSIEWRLVNGLFYFNHLSRLRTYGEDTKDEIAYVGLHSIKGIYLSFDSTFLFINKIPVRTRYFTSYVNSLKERGKEDKIVKRYFNNKERINYKLSKAKSVEEVFNKKSKIHFYWFYRCWDDANTWLYSIFKEPKHPH
jgi:hypothetical protein